MQPGFIPFVLLVLMSASSCAPRGGGEPSPVPVDRSGSRLEPGGAPSSGPLAGSRQLVLVETPAWDAVDGTLRRFERDGLEGSWRPVAGPVPVAVGRSGMGWGRGLHVDPGDGPRKREGDGRASAGAFRLETAFGFASAEEAGPLRLPYLELSPSIECVDDPASRHYNRLVDRARIDAPDWKSAEQMRAFDPYYAWGVVVGHNSSDPIPGAGSCIFLHVWAGPGVGSAGCTQLEGGAMLELLRWLEAARHPVLVQLPAREAARVRRAWGLPGGG